MAQLDNHNYCMCLVRFQILILTKMRSKKEKQFTVKINHLLRLFHPVSLINFSVSISVEESLFLKMFSQSADLMLY